MGGWMGAQPTLVIAECNIHVLLLLAGHERVNNSLETQYREQQPKVLGEWHQVRLSMAPHATEYHITVALHSLYSPEDVAAERLIFLPISVYFPKYRMKTKYLLAITKLFWRHT